MAGLGFGDRGDLAVFAVHFDGFTDQGSSFFSAFGGRCQGEGCGLAVFTFHNNFLGRCVEFFQFTFVGDNLAAACVSGAESEGGDSEDGECFVHGIVVFDGFEQLEALQ